MIFKATNILLASVFGLALAPAAFADSNCVIGCGTGSGPNLSLNVTGNSAIGGNVGSIFNGTTGSNDLTKGGGTVTIIESSLGGFCTGDDCAGSTLLIDLQAVEFGTALTKAGGETSGEDVTAQNSGAFTSATQGAIDFGGTSTMFGTQGAAAFANLGGVNATGGTVNTVMESFGSGITDSALSTNGTACPTCADISGGTTSASQAGISLLTTSVGGTAGQLVGIVNSGHTQAATNVGNMFQQTTVSD
jgi:hypothetical protein